MSLSAAERQAAYAARNPERVRDNWKRYAHTPKGTVTLLLNYAKDRARRGGYPFALSREWLEAKLKTGVCELTGITLHRVSPGEYRTHPYAPSLDRIVPKKGYVEDNVRLVCFAANRARSDFGDDVLLAVAEGLIKHVTR